MREYGEFLYDTAVILAETGRRREAKFLLKQAYVAASLVKDDFRKRVIAAASITRDIDLEQGVLILGGSMPNSLEEFNKSIEPYQRSREFKTARNDFVIQLAGDISSGRLPLAVA